MVSAVVGRNGTEAVPPGGGGGGAVGIGNKPDDEPWFAASRHSPLLKQYCPLGQHLVTQSDSLSSNLQPSADVGAAPDTKELKIWVLVTKPVSTHVLVHVFQ